MINKSYVVSEDDPPVTMSGVRVARRKSSAISMQTLNSYPTIREESDVEEVDACVKEYEDKGRERLLNDLKTIGIIFFFFFLFSIHSTFSILKVIHLSKKNMTGLRNHEAFSILIELIAIAGMAWLILKTTVLRDSDDELDQSSMHGGLDLLFRIGVILFFIGRTISHIFDVLMYYESQYLSIDGCVYDTPLLYPMIVFSIVMDIMVTYLVFKYHGRKLINNIYIVRLILGVLIIFNIMGYVENIVKGTKSFYERAELRLKEAELNKTTCLYYFVPENCTGLFMASGKIAERYLFSFDVVFPILIVGALVQFMLETWEPFNEKFHRCAHHTGPTSSKYNADDNSPSSQKPNNASKKHRYSSTFFSKAHIGLFLSMLFLAGWIVIAIFGLALKYGNDHDGHCINKLPEVVDIVIFLTGIILVIYLTIRITTKFRHDECPRGFVHIFLMYVSAFGSTFLSILMIIADIRSLMYDYIDEEDSTILLVHDLIEFFQMVIQTIFILASYNLRASSKEERLWMPGKGALMFLSCLNVILWLDKTISFHSVILNLPSLYTYDINGWCIIAGTFKPLMIFYRFHSATMSVEMLTSLYP